MTRTTLPATDTADLDARVAQAAAQAAGVRPARVQARQPVHTVYVPADRVDATTVSRYGREARRLLDAHAPDGASLADTTGVAASLADRVRDRVAWKLATEPVEDLRIDFEDGYGVRDDATEDADASRTAHVAGDLLSAGVAPPFVGLRVKSFADGGHQRAVRTLDIFLTTLLDRAGRLPDGLAITFPKVVAAGHVAVFAEVLQRLEHGLGLPERALTFEVQVETTESIIDRRGRVALPAIVDAAGGRMVAAHFGVFDYTAACGLPAAGQRLDHPACDFARHVMQVSLAGTGIMLSDGSTNRVPGADTRAAVGAVWRHHADLVRRSIAHGFFQGWDMHPSHLVSRFAAVFAFHLGHLDDTTRRLAAWSAAGDGSGSATGSATAPGPRDMLDEPATIRALLTSLRRAIDCGAVDESTALGAARLGASDLRGRSAGRGGAPAPSHHLELLHTPRTRVHHPRGSSTTPSFSTDSTTPMSALRGPARTG